MGLEVKPLHPLFGSEVRGVDFSKPPEPELVATIRALMDDLAVLVIRDQALDDEQHIALSRAFGPLELPPDYGSGAPRRLRRELYDASNLDVAGRILATDAPRREYNKANLTFHADSTFNDLPTTWSLLRAHTVPAEGGNTEFIDARVVYDDLPEATKARIARLRAVHDFWHSHAEGKYFKVTDEMRRGVPPVEQDLVTVLPDGRRSLCIGSHTSGIVGMPSDEGRALLDELYAFATQRRYVYSHPWREGDLIIWDNRRTLHRASPWQDNRQIRDLRRTTLLESGPEISATERRGSEPLGSEPRL
jgi:alpha-ketoglutarate-dependent 2,4-dichlorophenoxyacetate dioxygenase